jgi:G:T-mismatch repair DNA endonuclease (very short patch repair protein)
MINCLKCDYRAKSRSGIVLHYKIHNLSAVEIEQNVVYALYGKNEVDAAIERYINHKECCNSLLQSGLNLSKYLTLLGIKRSSKEERQTTRYKEKYISSIKKKYGDHITNISQVAEVQKKKVQTVESKNQTYDEYLFSQRSKMKAGFTEYLADTARRTNICEKIKSTIFEKYGVNNISQHPEIAAKISATKKNRCALLSEDERRNMTIAARQSWANKGDWESKIEKRVQHALVDLSEKFLPHVFLFGYNYDILLSDRIIIEIQGDYWHANPKMYIETDTLHSGKIRVKDIWNKDQKKLDIVVQNGYNMIYVWESEINAVDQDSLINLLRGKIYNARN